MLFFSPNKITLHLRCLLIIGFLFICQSLLYSEGTKQLVPNNDDRLYLMLTNGLYNNFGRYNGTVDQRLLININDPNNEQVFLGFSAPTTSGHYPCSGSLKNAYFRIKDPNGNVVFPIANNPNGQLINNTNANLNSRAAAIVGPNQIAGVGGYDAITFDPSGLPAGDYYIEFSSIQENASINNIIAIEHFDITVATKAANPTAIEGRVYSTNWAFHAPSISCGTDVTFGYFDRSFNGSFHVYSDDGFVSKIDFDNSGFQPAAFNIYFNANGTGNTGNLIEDRKSTSGTGTQNSLHKIFLTEPDINVFPSGILGTINGDPVYKGCEGGDACFELMVTSTGQINVLLDFDNSSGPGIYDPNTSDRILVFKVAPTEGEIAPFTRCVPWDREDGLGNIISDESSFETYLVYGQGVYHLPIYDVEYMLTGFKPTTIRPVPPEGSPDKLYYDDTPITFLPGNGNPTEEINGCLAPCHTWTNSDYGNLNTINTWYFSREEIQLENDAPTCGLQSQDDFRTTPFETPIDIIVLSNDMVIDLDTNLLRVTNIIPQNGMVEVNIQNGKILYTPNSNFIGLDSFEYEICHNILPERSLCDRSFVYVTVSPDKEMNCFDGLDNDNDGFIDCDDTDCLPQQPGQVMRKN